MKTITDTSALSPEEQWQAMQRAQIGYVLSVIPFETKARFLRAVREGAGGRPEEILFQRVEGGWERIPAVPFP